MNTDFGSASRLFTDEETKIACDWLVQMQARPVFAAIRFRNAMHACLRDVDRAQSASPPLKILAIDTVEVMTPIQYMPSIAAAFAFRNVLVDPDQRTQSQGRLETFDRLVNHYLINEMRNGHVLLDGHADEISMLRHLHDGDVQTERGRLYQYIPEELGAITRKQLDGIYSWLSQQGTTDRSVEWDRFRQTFLPNWREEMFDHLVEARARFAKLDDYVRNGHYCFIRPGSFGHRSIVSKLSNRGFEFDWSAYESFASTGSASSRFDEAYRIMVLLLEKFQRRQRPALDAAIDRDARAIAQLDLLNCFLISQRANVRVELVSRSPSLHSALAAVPDGRLHVTLRHPLFIPDIYDFDPASLASIGDILQRVDNVIASFISAAEERPSFVGGQIDHEEADESSAMHEIAKAARGVLPVLEDILSIKQSHDVADRSVYYREITSSLLKGSRNSSRRTQTAVDEISPRIEAIFDLLLSKLRIRSEPLQEVLSSELLKQISRLAEFERQRTFGANSKLTLRIIDFSGEFPDGGARSIELVPFLVIRAVTGVMRRVFHVHSSRVRSHLLSAASAVGKAEPDALTPQQCVIDISDIFAGLDEAITSLSQEKNVFAKSPDSDDWAYNIESVLLVCLAFACFGRLDTVVAISSVVLHQAAESIRNDGSPCANGAIKASLAYRELFLLRHYCERKLALEDFFATKRRVTDSKGSVAKNLARAQRDLDFAGAMTGIALSCVDHECDRDNIEFSDWRISLATLGGWIDQLLMLSKEMGSTWDPGGDQHRVNLEEVRRRFDIWTSISVIRELTGIASRARAMSETCPQTPSGRVSRYLANVEARALQGALTLFLIFLAYPISPELHRLWTTDADLKPERTLIFRSWQDWWKRYSDLMRRYNFDMSIIKLIDPVIASLSKIAEMRLSIKAGTMTPEIGRELSTNEMRELVRVIKSNAKGGEPNGVFQKALADALVDRLQELSQAANS